MTKKKYLVVTYLKNSDPSELLLVSMMWKQMYIKDVFVKANTDVIRRFLGWKIDVNATATLETQPRSNRQHRNDGS